MKWKLIENSYDDAECSECSTVLAEGVQVYWKRNKGATKGIIMCTQCYKRYASNADAEHASSSTASTSTSTSTSSQSATTTPTPIAPSREETIAKAHDENMEANQRLVLQLAALTTALVDLGRIESDRNALLKQNMGAKT